MRCVFWTLIHSQEYPCSSQICPSDKSCWRILEDLHCQEYIQFFDIHNCLFMRLHFTIGCYDRRRTARLRHGFHYQNSSPFSWWYASTRLSRQQILVPQVQELMQVGTYFPKVRRVMLYFLRLIQDALSQPPRCITGTLLLPLRLFLRLILKFWSVGVTLMRTTWANHSKQWMVFCSRMLTWRITALVNWTHRIGFRMSELFLKIDEDFDGSISWNTQP